jgi:hypothetical protein
VKTTEAIMEILAAYDLTQSYRDAAELVGCSHHTVARYVQAREAGELRTTPIQRSQLIDPFREKLEEWVEASHGRVRADVAQRKLEAMGYAGSDRTTRCAVAEAKATYQAGHRRRFRPWLPEPGLWSSGTTPTGRWWSSAAVGCGARGWHGASIASCCRFATRRCRRSSPVSM